MREAPSLAPASMMLADLTVVVPVRNAERMLDDCLTSVTRSGVREIIVVDGRSDDRSVEIARQYGARVLTDRGRGLPVARALGARAATTRFVALIDADVVLPDGALAQLLAEFVSGGYTALQAGLLSTSGPGYWGRALVHHHRTGRSKNWFGVVATLFERDTLLEYGFDDRFLSGEDIELRWRLERGGKRIGVSTKTLVEHRFAEDSWDFAKQQWLADGQGLGRMIRKHRWRGVRLLLLPAAAGVRGVALSLLRVRPQWVPYFACFTVYNYAGMAREFARRSRSGSQRARRSRAAADGGSAEPDDDGDGRPPRAMVRNSLGLVFGKIAQMAIGFLFWLLAARLYAAHDVGLAAGTVSAMMLSTQFALMGVGSAFIARYPHHQDKPAKLLDSALSLAGVFSLAAGALFLLLATHFLGPLRIVASAPAFAVLFLVMTLLGTAGILLDQVSVAVGRGHQVLVRSVAMGFTMLAGLVGLALVSRGAGAEGLFLLWVLGGLVATGLGMRQLARLPFSYRYRPRLTRPIVRRLVRVGLPNHALTLTERAPGLLLPIFVTELLSPTTNAYWYVAWMMAWVVYTAPISVGIALFAEASHRPQSATGAARRAIRSALVLGGLGALGLAVLARPALGLLGGTYADAAATPLRILLVAVVPLAFVQAYYARCRAAGRLREAIATGVITATIAVVAAVVAGVAEGLWAMAAAWTGVQAVAGLWAVARLRQLPVELAESAERARQPGQVSGAGRTSEEGVGRVDGGPPRDLASAVPEQTGRHSVIRHMQKGPTR